MLKASEALEFKRELNLVQYYRHNPVIAAHDLLRVDLDVPQQFVLESMWFKTYVLVTAGRGTGKTFLNAVMACLSALLYPGQRVGLLAPSFRQAKLLFAEVDKRWQQAPLLQEAVIGRPTRASDRCYLNFRQSGFGASSVIEAVPLGDGTKIRGARYYLILADEFAQIPETIFNTVILPMGATVAEPMENVKKIARERELIRSGLATKDDFATRAANKVIMTSSAFYRFNHMYDRKCRYEEMLAAGDNDYVTHTISLRHMSEGFLEEKNITNAQATLSTVEFEMEYEAIWKSDSAGVFKASLFEKCRANSEHSVLLSGRSGAEYVLGVDPARASDAFALFLIELGSPSKVVAAWEYYQNVFPKMARTIMGICDSFNVVAINMDAGAGGGGLAMKDLLEEEERWGTTQRILDAEDEELEDAEGRRILYMFNPSPKSNAEAVYACLNLLEQGNLYLPKRPQAMGPSESAFKSLDEAEELYDTVDRAIKQAMLIEVSESKSGVAHFDVPSGGGHATQKKDLFTAFVLASKKAYELMLFDEDEELILEVGIIESRPDYQTPVDRKKLTKTMEVTQVPVNSWAFRKTFKP